MPVRIPAIKEREATRQRRYLVLQMLSEGYAPKQIAFTLKMSHGTIKDDMMKTRNELDAANTVHSVAIAMARDLIPGPEPKPERHLWNSDEMLTR